MSQYKVRASKRDDGGYDLSYGKGQKKIAATTQRDPSNNKWFVDVIGHYKKLSDLKVSWGKWATERYHGTSKTIGETVPIDAASPPPVVPSLVRSDMALPLGDPTVVPLSLTVPPHPLPAAPKHKSKHKSKGNGIVPIPPEGEDGRALYAINPNAPRFRYPEDHPDEHLRGKVTPLGILLAVQAWHERYKDRIGEINHKIAVLRVPGFNPFSFLRMMIDEIVEREVPKETDDGKLQERTCETTAAEVSGDQRTVPPCP